MKTIVACVLGLAAFATSCASGGSPAYADAVEMVASAVPILAPGAQANDIADQLHCVLYSDGADNCVVNVQPEALDEQSTAVGKIDMSPIEPATAVRFVDAIPVVVVQTVTIAAPGPNAESKDTAYIPALPAPAAEPILDADAKTTTGTLLPLPAGNRSADAIVVAIVQSTTVAANGQSARDGEAGAQAESMSGLTALISIARKTTAPGDEE